ncbi:hypothetical protein ACNE9Y_28675 [Pseudomonas sp. NY11226]|uniref:hypothetical protein n=1 Tax=Pseudomonas sp. NY11226 TaxID=3400362 RepID=UPI003A890A8A
MGTELDVLVGHPEHELLFVATQVARAAGLKNPSNAIFSFHRKTGKTPDLLAWESIKPVSQNLGDHIKLGDLVGADKKSFLNIPQRADTRNWSALWLMPSSSVIW